MFLVVAVPKGVLVFSEQQGAGMINILQSLGLSLIRKNSPNCPMQNANRHSVKKCSKISS